MKKILLRCFLLLAILGAEPAFAQSLDERRPNIDRLAEEGTRFTRYDATGVT